MIPAPGRCLRNRARFGIMFQNEFGDTFASRWRFNRTVAMIKFVWHFAPR
jgi:hypothetical protein